MLTLLLGGLGLGGFGLASFLLPAFLPAVISAGGAVLRCKPCLIVLGGLALFVWGDVHGHRKSDAKCAAADIAMRLQAKERDANILADTIKFKQTQIDDLAAETEALKKQKADYDKVPKVACPLGADRAGRLRNILTR